MSILKPYIVIVELTESSYILGIMLGLLIFNFCLQLVKLTIPNTLLITEVHTA